MLKTTSFFILLLYASMAWSQGTVSEEKIHQVGAQGSFAYEFPGGDLAERFGSNANAGGGFYYKTKKNIMFTLEGSYLFSENIREDSLFHLIRNPDGYIIDGDGMYADVRTYQRGFSVMFKAGKVFNVFNDNPNSGLVVMAGGGFLQHRIRIENPGQTVAQLKGDYKKGYDKLTNGPALSQYIGYVHYSDNRVLNFRIGFEFTQAFTQARRNYDFDLMGPDTRERVDLLYGVKLSWMIPFRKRKLDSFYFF